ncbi:MAG TPA: hypothetical protein H9795_11845, partial [Candidatus Fournierella merdigallinarum]|nr:hypothetical protein [Candidatus Fournierella merdigallinarum]
QSLASCELLFGIFKVLSTLKKGSFKFFLLFNFQGPLPRPSRRQLAYYISLFSLCQELLKDFSQVFRSVSLAFLRPCYNTTLRGKKSTVNGAIFGILQRFWQFDHLSFSFLWNFQTLCGKGLYSL